MDQKALYEICRVRLVKISFFFTLLIRSLWNERGLLSVYARLTGNGRESPDWCEERHESSDVVRVKERLNTTKRCEQYDSTRPLAATDAHCLPVLVGAAQLLFGFKDACELHCHGGSEAVPNDEHVLRRSTVSAQPIP